jgi:hypothetical protein
MTKSDPAEAQLHEFMARYTPHISHLARVAVAKLRERLPWANVLVYDNYNALAIGFGPSERTIDAILSIALFPKWVSLFFLKGAGLDDPSNLLKGSGKVARHIVLDNAQMLDKPAVRALINQALKKSHIPFDPGAKGKLIIKSVSEKQRPRRPG